MIILYRHYPSSDHIACLSIQNVSVYNYYPIFYLYYKTALSCIIVAKFRYPLASHLFPKSTENYGQAILQRKIIFWTFYWFVTKSSPILENVPQRLHLRNELEFPWLVPLHTRQMQTHIHIEQDSRRTKAKGGVQEFLKVPNGFLF